MKKSFIYILSILVIVSFVVMASGCTSSDNNTNNTTNVSDLEKNILIENMTITPSSIGDGYDVSFKLTYTGDKTINYRLWIEPYPFYNSTKGESELPNQKIETIAKGQSFKIEFTDLGGYVTNPNEITGFQFLIGVNYEQTNDSISPDDSFYTPVYPVKS